MSEWNAMTFEGKPAILRVVRDEAEQIVRPGRATRGSWESPTAMCQLV